MCACLYPRTYICLYTLTMVVSEKWYRAATNRDPAGPSPLWRCQKTPGFPNFVPYCYVSDPFFLIVRLGQAGFWLLLSTATCSVFLIIPFLPRTRLPEILSPSLTEVSFFTSPWTNFSFLAVVLCQEWHLWDLTSFPLFWFSQPYTCLLRPLDAVVSLPPAVRPYHLFGFCSYPMCFFHLPYDVHYPLVFAHMEGPATHSWRMSRMVGLCSSEFTVHVGGLAEIQVALLMTLSCHSLLSPWLVLEIDDIAFLWRIGLNMYMENGFTDRQNKGI